MKEFIEKLIGRLEEYQGKIKLHFGNRGDFDFMEVDAVKEIVNELAEEYKNTNIITDFLQYARDNADNYDTNEGWALADLIDLSIKYSEEYINTSTDSSTNLVDTSTNTSTTNADRIRSMNDEELAEFLYDTNHYFENNEYLVRFGSEIVQDEEINILDWLKSEVEGVTEAYEKEQEKARQKIMVGDIVALEDGIKGVVMDEDGVDNVVIFTENGCIEAWMNKKYITKTGKHIDIQSILKQIGSDVNELS